MEQTKPAAKRQKRRVKAQGRLDKHAAYLASQVTALEGDLARDGLEVGDIVEQVPFEGAAGPRDAVTYTYPFPRGSIYPQDQQFCVLHIGADGIVQLAPLVQIGARFLRVISDRDDG